MSVISFKIDVTATVEAIRLMEDMIGERTYDALYEVRDETREAAQDHLSVLTHPAGTPTPSVAPMPPARITGRLATAWHDVDVHEVGWHVYEARTGPVTVYARAQELGRPGGRWPYTTLPPRPYLMPVVTDRQRSGRYLATFMEYWDEALRAATIA